MDDLLSVLHSVEIDEKTLPLEEHDWSFWTHAVLESKSKEKLDVDYESFDFESFFFCSIDPLVKMRLACEACSNDVEFEWDIFNTINAQYYTEAEVFHKINQKYKVTLITEGSSDTNILLKAISNYAPEVYDLFDFIDLKKNYPCTGTGNMGKLFDAMVNLNVMNRMLFIFDNDAEGNAKAKCLLEKDHPNNIMITTLPDLVELETVPISGPIGTAIMNANRVACSIECFLDFSPIGSVPMFEYKSKVKNTGIWQGEICKKKQLLDHINDIGKENYDSSKLFSLIAHIQKIIARGH